MPKPPGIFSKRRGSRNAFKKNVMAPLGWYLGFADTLFMAGILGANEPWIRYFCAILLVICVGIFAVAYFYWMKNDPDRLQSEGYNLESQELTLLGAIHQDAPLTVETQGGLVITQEPSNTSKTSS